MNSRPQRVTRRIRIGAYLGKGTSIYRIVSWALDNLTVRVIEEPSGSETTVSLPEILEGEYRYADTEQGLLPPEVGNDNPPQAGLPKHLLDKAKKIAQVIEGFEAWLEVARQTSTTEPRYSQTLAVYTAQRRLCIATFYNYRRIYQRCHGDVARIAAEMRRSSYGKKRLSHAQQHFLDMLILRYPTLAASEIRRFAEALLERTGGLWVKSEYCNAVPNDLVQELCNPKIAIEPVVHHPEKRNLLAPMHLPGKTSFYEYYHTFTTQPDGGQCVIDQRYGEGTWNKQLRVFDTFIHHAVEPLQYVFLDHCLLDVFTVDAATRRHRNRLWLTVLIDAYTRSVLGMALLYEPPSIESVQSALQQAIWPKNHLVEGEWRAYGVPIQLSLDNAWAHHAHSLESLARDPELQIDLVYRPVYQGRYGALIERYFGNLAGRLRQHLKNAGGIVSREPKALGNAAKTACLLYDDLYHFLLEEIATYQNTPHRELNGITPNQKWEIEEREHGIVAPPSCTLALQRKFWREYNGQRPITEKGICLFGMHYHSLELQQLPPYTPVPHVQQEKKTQKALYSLRFNPHDISCIAIFEGAHYVCDAYAFQLRLPDGSYLPVSLAEREMAKDIARAWGNTDVGRDWLHYFEHLQTTIKARQAEQRRAYQMNTPQTTAPVAPKPPTPQPDDKSWLAQADNALDTFWKS